MKFNCSWKFLILRRLIILVQKKSISNPMGEKGFTKTAILWIVADGTKLPTMLMFKGQPDGRVERKLHKNSLVKDKKISSYWQPKSLNNMTIMKKMDQRG